MEPDRKLEFAEDVAIALYGECKNLRAEIKDVRKKLSEAIWALEQYSVVKDHEGTKYLAIETLSKISPTTESKD